jgi:protein-disulfide isomerase
MSCPVMVLRTMWPFALASLVSGCEGDMEPVYNACPVPLSGAPVRGPADAWVTIVEFADFQCSYCQAAESTIAEVDASRPGLRWSFRYFPISSLHPNAVAAASAADCANEQGQFWAMHDMLFATSSLSDTALAGYAEQLGLDMDAWNACFQSDDSVARIDADFQIGLDHGVRGTPTFFINDQVLPGAYPTADFLSTIDEAEAEAKAAGIGAVDYYESLGAAGCDG